MKAQLLLHLITVAILLNSQEETLRVFFLSIQREKHGLRIFNVYNETNNIFIAFVYDKHKEFRLIHETNFSGPQISLSTVT